MDELKLRLSSKIMRGFVTNLISKALFKKLGYHVDIELTELEIKTEDGKVRLHVNANAEVRSDEFKEIIKSIGLD